MLKISAGSGLAGRDDDLPGLHGPGLPGQRDDSPAFDIAVLEADAWVAHLGRADEVVERHPVGLRQREEQLQGRPPLPGLETGQGLAGRLGGVHGPI